MYVTIHTKNRLNIPGRFFVYKSANSFDMRLQDALCFVCCIMPFIAMAQQAENGRCFSTKRKC